MPLRRSTSDSNPRRQQQPDSHAPLPPPQPSSVWFQPTPPSSGGQGEFDLGTRELEMSSGHHIQDPSMYRDLHAAASARKLLRSIEKIAGKRGDIDKAQRDLHIGRQTLSNVTERLVSAVAQLSRLPEVQEVNAIFEEFRRAMDALREQEEASWGQRNQLSSLEFGLRDQEQALVEVAAHLTDVGKARLENSDADAQSDYAVPATASDTPSILTRYFDRKGDIHLHKERLQRLEERTEKERLQRNYLQDQERRDELTGSDDEFEDDYQRQRLVYLTAIHAAERDSEELAAQCKARDLDTSGVKPPHSGHSISAGTPATSTDTQSIALADDDYNTPIPAVTAPWPGSTLDWLDTVGSESGAPSWDQSSTRPISRASSDAGSFDVSHDQGRLLSESEERRARSSESSNHGPSASDLRSIPSDATQVHEAVVPVRTPDIQESVQTLEPYMFSRHEFEQLGIISPDDVPKNRRTIDFDITSAGIGSFIIRLRYEGQCRGLLNLDVKLDDLLAMQREQQEHLDMGYVQLRVTELLQLLDDKFNWKEE
ncbi:RasGAP protein [Elasticomyces elasticus]|uniref:RasGAP protein n=1 Tax=Elasticomyces elasticus TaxID=574655 RepID=A0AAN7ZMJ7_9PEZI|nr:RasGAP protein [Elasticomyces elasticus]